MKIFLKLLCVVLLASSAPDIKAFIFDNCNQYECSCEPLYCGAWGLQVQAGVRPTRWGCRGDFLTLDISNSVLPFLTEVPKFSNLYRLPWQVGGQLSYAFSTHMNVFTEVNYAQAKAKSSVVIDDTRLALLNKYKLIDWYVGARYYTDRWCDRVSLFIGGKLGFVHHKLRNLSQFGELVFSSDCSGCGFSGGNSLCSGKTRFAGGGHLGLDICYCGNWSFVLTAEVVAVSKFAMPLLFAEAGQLNSPDGIFAFIRRELAFPITFGVKYNF